MSNEREPSPEKKLPRLFDKCDNCEEEYDLTPENTTMVLHEVNNDNDYVRMTCDHCKHIFIMPGLSEDFIALAVNHGIEPSLRRYPDKRIVDIRLQQLGIELVRPVEITPRHEKLIGHFALTLENCPDDMLFDLITDENNKPYPPRWK